MTLIPSVLAITKIQAFWLLIGIFSFPCCSVLSLLPHPPTAFLPPLFTLPSGAPVLLHIMFLTPPGLNRILALSQGHHFPGRGCLCSHILFFPYPLSQGGKGEVTVLPVFQCSSQSISLTLQTKPLSSEASAVLFYPPNSFPLSSVNISWSVTPRFCHISESSLW